MTGPASPVRPARSGRLVELGRLRWWEIPAATRIEADLFGAERWSPAMFWNELANGHFYLAARSAGGESAAGGELLTGGGEPAAGGELVGYAGLAVQPPDEAWVQNIAVRRDAQRAGIGRALLVALLTEAARRGTHRTLLEVAVDNVPAQRLYARYGFEPVGIRRGYYQPSNTDALVMRCEMDEFTERTGA